MQGQRFYPSGSRSSRSFTLLEIVVVMAIIAILTGLSIVSFNSIVGADSVVSGAYNVSSYIELARNEAIARQSYVWVGCSNVTTGTNAPEVLFAAVASMDGSTNSAQSNLVGLSQVLRVRGISLTSWSALKTATQNLFTNGVTESLSQNKEGISFNCGQLQFSEMTITFTPRGEALLKGAPAVTDGYTKDIDISLRQAHGAAVTATADDAAVVIDGATGNPFIVRLQ